MGHANLHSFPPQVELETPRVLRELVPAHRYLAELKGVARSIPNEKILVSTLALQEAQSSSEIENIVTTQDALFKYKLQPESRNPATKEVARYAEGLETGFESVIKNKLLSLNTIIDIHEVLEGHRSGFRKLPGTVLQNQATGEIIFEPPAPDRVPQMMADLEHFIHSEKPGLDPLVRMALIHHQFETIHPFYDGNGRTGRIVNILFLVKEGLLNFPILYLSRYINQNKDQYYELLQAVRDESRWEDWILYMLRGVALTAQHLIELIEQIATLQLNHKRLIRKHHKFYSQDLINNIFRHPYTKVAFLEKDLRVSRATASRYLDALTEDHILVKHKLGRENYYINQELVRLLFDMPEIGTG